MTQILRSSTENQETLLEKEQQHFSVSEALKILENIPHTPKIIQLREKIGFFAENNIPLPSTLKIHLKNIVSYTSPVSLSSEEIQEIFAS